ncbi:Symplekin tight junction protein C terminal-domain-containing protein [Amylostereum chailletii]|nr:Symplekin tight junction protein C terminal-domain-containing protein [Amylostereum chailletii]
MASNNVDPLQLFQAALAYKPADSPGQADLLAALRESLEAHPHLLPVLCNTLIQTVANAEDSLLKRWVIDLLHFGIARAPLPLETRAQLASQSLHVLDGLLHDLNPRIVKVVVQIFAGAYPLLFRLLCTNRSARQQWETLNQAKTRILEMVFAPHINAGVRLSAVKFMQKAILVQTRGIADPRLQNKNDPNLSMCPVDHPFIPVAALENEGVRLLEGILTLLFTSPNPDIITAILNSWANLVKLRPALVQLVVQSLATWTPAALSGQSYANTKSVERAVRILLLHISRIGANAAPYMREINDALAVQGARTEKAAAEEKARKLAAKRPAPTPTSSVEPPDAKRQKLDNAPQPSTILAGFDFTSLPASLITELIVANLQAFSEAELQHLVQVYLHPGAPQVPVQAVEMAQAAPPVPPSAPASMLAASQERLESQPPEAGPSTVLDPSIVVEEPVDPLQMDIDDEVEYDAEKGVGEPMQEDDEVVAAAAVASFDVKDFLSMDLKIPPPRILESPESESLVRSSIARIWDEAQGNTGMATGAAKTGQLDMWMLLLVRMVTRGADPGEKRDKGKGKEKVDAVEDESESMDDAMARYEKQDRLRTVLCDYIMADFSGRMRLATAWMNEEWYNDQLRQEREPDWRQNYDTWLSQIVAAYLKRLDGRDRTFGRFLLDLPSVPPDVFSLMRDLCVEPDRMHVGFTTLRDFVTQRPTMRVEALNILLDLTTHPEKVTRHAAITTVKRWIGDMQPVDSIIRDFALQLLRRLQYRPPIEKKTSEGEDENMEDGQLPQEDLLQTPYLEDQLTLPAKKEHVVQHIELLFALSPKAPEFLDEIFSAYGEMDVSVQEAIQDLITALVRSLGSSNGKLLTILRTFPPGADTLALRVLNIFTDQSRPSAQLLALVKGLVAERDVDARFLIPIIAEMDKQDIMRHLPRIVSILDGKAERKALVRSVFGAIVTTPPQGFGSVSSNMPRVRQSELLTPSELMVLLHASEKEIGQEAAKEAIEICLSMTDVFRGEVLAAVMQQIVDEPVLPTLFMRTVIRAVTTYKSLVGFVSTTLLSRLITKKIWTNAPLWNGFILCATLIAPASFGALLQLPKEQLRELVNKQPKLKTSLREFVMKKPGNKARVAGLLDIFGDEGTPVPGAIATNAAQEQPPPQHGASFQEQAEVVQPAPS